MEKIRSNNLIGWRKRTGISSEYTQIVKLLVILKFYAVFATIFKTTFDLFPGISGPLGQLPSLCRAYKAYICALSFLAKA